MFVRCLLLALGVLSFGTVGAMAADMPVKAAPIAPPPLFSWTGFYIGGNAGGLWARSSEGWTIDPANSADAAGAIAARQALSAQTLKASSFTGGLQAGYNWQTGPLVIGLEADINWAHASTTSFFPTLAPLFGAPGDGNNLTQAITLNWYGTARGRIGYAWDRMLFYATGGFAFGQVHYFDSSSYAAGVTETADVTKTKTGWALGGGVEYALWQNWSVRGEYLHIDLGSEQTYSSLQPAFAVAYFHNHRVTADIGRIAINYRFGGM
jgi:outer membrane immunogenic protein